MLQSLLVPLDGSEFSERTLPLARGLARATGASLHLAHVHVSHPPDHFLSNTQFHFEGLDMEEYEERHRAQEEAYLNRVLERVREDGTRVDGALLEGRVAEKIGDHAEDVGADMILITTHGHTGVSRMWLGSVADALVRSTHLPLLVIHPAQGEHLPAEVLSFNNILVPLDGSDLATAILGPAKDIASATDAQITLAHVISSTAIVGSRLFPLLPDDITPAMRKAVEYLDDQAEALRDEGFAVETRVVEHEIPAKAICWMAEEAGADLIAIATHGYGGVKRAFLGSVADKVLRGSPLPLLVQRPF